MRRQDNEPRQEQYVRPGLIRLQKEKVKQNRNIAFVLLIIASQIVFVVMHSIYVRTKLQFDQHVLPFVLFKTLILALVTTLGFGLLFSYNIRLVFSGLGITLFVMAYELQLYPLINLFWRQVGLQVQDSDPVLFSNPLYLSQYTRSFSRTFYKFDHNSIEGCFKAAMAINVAVSSVLGRVNLFDIWICMIIGTFGYELNRKICVSNYGDDAFGSMYIFAFGGFMGLSMGLFLRAQEKQYKNTVKNQKYTANAFSAFLALIGSAILSVSLPFLCYGYHVQHSKDDNQWLQYTPILNLILAASQGLMGGIIISLFSNGKICIRDFIYGPVAGIILFGTASYFTINMAYTLGAGLAGGLIQSGIQNIFERIIARHHRPISTISFSLFAIQGFLACVIAVIGKQIAQKQSRDDDLDYLDYENLNYESVRLLYFGLVSAGIGLGCGIVIGLIYYFVNTLSKKDYFNDLAMWVYQIDPDGEVFVPKTLYQIDTRRIQNESQFSLPTITQESDIQIPY